jgi:hypothetical protein
MAIDKATPMDTDEETLPTGNTTLKDKTMTDASSAPLAVYSTEEEEARQAIEMMKGDDLANRIAAAGRLDFVAKALGEKRTREVSMANHEPFIASWNEEHIVKLALRSTYALPKASL